MLSYRARCGILVSIAVVAAIGLLCWGPIPQDPNYHRFADARTIVGVGNFWNVVSNLPFVIVGFIGLRRVSSLVHPETVQGYLALCVGALGVGLGSAYYHHVPNNGSLLWDRLPMTVAFMAVLSLVLHERVIHGFRPWVLWGLVFVGIGTGVYWAWTESQGKGDLRPYAYIQFLPVVLMPLILALFPRRYLSTRLLIGAFFLYVGAKVLEHLDAAVLSASGFMSGHPVKHAVAAGAVLCLVYAVPAGRDSRDAR